MRAEVQFPESTNDFWQDIQSLVATVRDVVISGTHDLPAQLLKIRTKLDSKGIAPPAMTERILKYSRHLLGIQTRFPPIQLQTEVEKKTCELMNLWLIKTSEFVERERADDQSDARGGPASRGVGTEEPETAPATAGWKSSDDFYARRDEVLMESLTAVWLALYFLGVPFIQPWERVRRMADERGGYPSGACVMKYVGDVYRISRLEMMRDLKDKRGHVPRGYDKDCQILVLSYSPLAVLKNLLDRRENTLTPAAPHLLGRCYALLQLRMYIDAGFPIRYFVSKESLFQNWKLLKDSGDSTAGQLDDIPNWIKTVFSNASERQTVQLLLDNDEIAGMATCVLAREIGMYVLDTTRTSIPFAGNRLTGVLLKSYREKLNRITAGETANVKELSAKNATEIKEILGQVLRAAS
jgi:hypothetical protein